MICRANMQLKDTLPNLSGNRMFETAAASQWLLRARIPYVCNVRYFLASRGEGSVFHRVPIRMSVQIRLKECFTFSALKHTS
jgi:hypothetical protein